VAGGDRVSTDVGEQESGQISACSQCGAPLPHPLDLEALATEVDATLSLEFKRVVNRIDWAGAPPDGLMENLAPWLSSVKQRRAIWNRGQALWAERVTASQAAECPNCGQPGAAAGLDEGEAKTVMLTWDPRPRPAAEAGSGSALNTSAAGEDMADEESGAATIMMRPPAAPRPVGEAPPPASPSPAMAGDPVPEDEPHESRTIIGRPAPAAPAARLVMVEGERDGLQFSLARPVTSIGRSVACQVTIDDPTLNPQHALVLRRDRHWIVQDAMGSGDIYVDDEPVAETRELRHGDVIRIGRARFRFESDESDERALP
jgi:hypothetical protein